MNKHGTDIEALPIEQVCDRISTLTGRMMDFWKNASGWAPMEAAGLLNKSMLEWQSSLAACLAHWLAAKSHGELILAWANLGSLIEGQLKLFLSVRYNEYALDVAAIKKQNGKLKQPDVLMLNDLRSFFNKRIWIATDTWDEWIADVQQKRNAIHAYKHCDIGTFDEWKMDLRKHLAFLRDMNSRLPYPDDIFEPREC